MDILEKTIYVVATPIGNMSDITYRAVHTLKNVSFIMAEDTRVSSKLLHYYEIKKEMVSYHSHSSNVKLESLLSRIEKGESAALISDAGTPAISDPGVVLVSRALERNISVVPIPGVTAFTTLLSVSGLPVNNMLFVGFLSNKPGKRKNQLQALYENDKKVIVFYESVHRIEAFMEDVSNIFGSDTHIVLGRELTKCFEEIVRDNAKNIVDIFEKKDKIVKGEYCVVVDNR